VSFHSNARAPAALALSRNPLLGAGAAAASARLWKRVSDARAEQHWYQPLDPASGGAPQWDRAQLPPDAIVINE
jgi:hypothetical protein